MRFLRDCGILEAMAEGKKTKQGLIQRLLDDGLCASREVAEKQVMAGLVRVDGVVVDKPGSQISTSAAVSLTPRREYVSRGAYKLEAACNAFTIQVAGKVCADVGVCTGGFTEILLSRGAAKVFAIDVGYGDLDWKIRSDPRVVVMERTNARYVDSLGEPIAVVVIDVSFISLSKILPAVTKWLVPGGEVVALVKPQFEANREDVGEGGIITDPSVHDRVLHGIQEELPTYGLRFRGLEPSPILGAEGNKEFLLWAVRE